MYPSKKILLNLLDKWSFSSFKNENRAYKEVLEFLKKVESFGFFTDGSGGIRGKILDFIQEVLQRVDDKFILNVIRSLKLTANKTYMLSDFKCKI